MEMAIPGGISLGFDGIGGLPVQPEMAIPGVGAACAA